MIERSPQEQRSRRRKAVVRAWINLSLFVVCFFAAWITWVLFLLHDPTAFSDPVTRAAVRMLLWFVPAVLYLKWIERRPVLKSLGLKDNRGVGMMWGLLASLVVFGTVLVYQVRMKGAQLNLALPLATWLNPILTAPFCEEIVFRGVIYRRLEQLAGTVAGLLGSAVLFSMIHFPYWYLSGEKVGMQLIVALGGMFVYGVIFALLYRGTRSLLTPWIFHSANNWMSTLIG